MSGRAAAEILTIGGVRRRAGDLLKAAGIGNASQEADWLLASVWKIPRHTLLLDGERTVSQIQAERAWACLKRRAERAPLQYLLGTQEFCGLDITVTPDVLIPRPESELLVEETLRAVAGLTRPTIIDVGTGSGCLAVALAREALDAKVYAVDVSWPALAVARSNAARHGVSERVRFVQADLLGAFSAGSIGDVVVSNPPYIPLRDLDGLQPEVARYEPRLALAAGEDGLVYHRRLLQETPALLRPGGFLIMEMGYGQAEAVTRLARERGAFDSVECRMDAAGIERVLVARVGTGEA